MAKIENGKYKITETSFELKISIASISRCINSHIKTTNNFKFKKMGVI